MDQATRNEIAAATAAHHELGRDYDGAVAESLVDRIGTEIDKRIDARLGSTRSGSRSHGELVRRGTSPAMWTGVGFGAGITGLVAMVANRGNYNSSVVGAVIVVWIILAVAALGVAAGRRNRGQGRD